MLGADATTPDNTCITYMDGAGLEAPASTAQEEQIGTRAEGCKLWAFSSCMSMTGFSCGRHAVLGTELV